MVPPDLVIGLLATDFGERSTFDTAAEGHSHHSCVFCTTPIPEGPVSRGGGARAASPAEVASLLLAFHQMRQGSG